MAEATPAAFSDEGEGEGNEAHDLNNPKSDDGSTGHGFGSFEYATAPGSASGFDSQQATLMRAKINAHRDFWIRGNQHARMRRCC
jgi:hypothetical protein